MVLMLRVGTCTLLARAPVTVRSFKPASCYVFSRDLIDRMRLTLIFFLVPPPRSANPTALA